MSDSAAEGGGAPGAAPAPFWAALRSRLHAKGTAEGSDPAGAESAQRPPPAAPADTAAAPFDGVLGMALVGWALDRPADEPEVRRGRLYNRYRIYGGWRWAVRLQNAGIDTVCLKGLAAAAATYPVAELRTMADADLLVRPQDLGRALRFLLQAGFAVGEEPTRSPWGFIGDASAEPLVSPEGVNLDLHQHADSWPLHRGLPTDRVFADSLECGTPEGPVRVPRPEHQLLVAASHAARDLFDAPSLKLVIDGAFLLQLCGGGGGHGRFADAQFDWQEVERRARAGDSLRPLRAYLSLLRMLELEPAGGLPSDLLLPPESPAERLLRDLAAGLLAGRFGDGSHELDARQKMLRELLLAASPRTVLRRNLRRLAGLVRPNRGVLNDAG